MIAQSMEGNMTKRKQWYAVFTILFFVLGIFNLLFAYLGFICMITPFILLLRDRKKTWCQRYCPRASLFDVLFTGRSLTGRPAPRFLTGRLVRNGFLVFFLINLFMLTMSTIMVSLGRVAAMEHLRFLIAFRLPFTVPQLIGMPVVPAWVLHLSFRITSMMMSTTVIGLLLGWIYRPRTWCAVCPIGTLSDKALHAMKKGESGKACKTPVLAMRQELNSDS